MSEQDHTQESEDWLRAELNAIEPVLTAPDRASNKARINADMANMQARAAKRLEYDRAVSRAGGVNIARKKYCARFGWTEAEFAENWKLRDVPAPDKSAVGFTVRRSMWDLLVDRERKRLTATPRKNADLSDATPEEKAARKRKQDAEAQIRRRAKVAAQKATQAVASSERLLTDDELSVIAAAEKE